MNSSSTRSSIDLFSEAASTPIVDTRANPIIRAEAVAPVRRGSRRAFSPARRPGAPNSLPNTARQATSTGLPMIGLITATVRIQITAPMPTQSASGPGAPMTPQAASTAPSARSAPPMGRGGDERCRCVATRRASPRPGRPGRRAGWQVGRDHRDGDAHDVADDHRARGPGRVRCWRCRDRSRGTGRPAPGRAPSQGDTDRRREERQHQRLEQDGPGDLLPGGAECAHEGQLPRLAVRPGSRTC